MEVQIQRSFRLRTLLLTTPNWELTATFESVSSIRYLQSYATFKQFQTVPIYILLWVNCNTQRMTFPATVFFSEFSAGLIRR